MQQTNVGPYEVVRKVAEGGMAVVYLAVQPGLDRRVALKELATFPADEPELAARFVHEARLAGSLTHPNIVTTHDFFVHDDRPYIAMEYVERGSLRPFARVLSLAQVGGVLEGTLSALAHAAGQSVVHRDVKPENVLVTSAGGVKLADFGIAKALNTVVTANVRTRRSTTIGTPAYMAPEQALSGEATARSDLYAVGVMAYEMVTGRLPFGTPGDTPMAILLGHMQGDFPPADLVEPTLDPRIARCIERLMAREPADRPQSPDEAWRELEDAFVAILGPFWRRDAALPEHPATAWAEPRASSARRASGGEAETPQPSASGGAEPLAGTAETRTPASVGAVSGARSRRRRRLAAMAAATALAAAGLAGTGAAALRPGAPAPLDVGRVESAIRERLAFQQPVRAVTCPRDVPRRAGLRFACVVRPAGGRQRLMAIVRQRRAGEPEIGLRLG
jgi:Protein kinase domain